MIQVAPAEVSTIMRSVTNALQYIHYLGIVHRDLKLGNILIDGNNTVKLGKLYILKKYYLFVL